MELVDYGNPAYDSHTCPHCRGDEEIDCWLCRNNRDVTLLEKEDYLDMCYDPEED